MPIISHSDLDVLELKLGKRHYLFYNDDTPFNNSSSACISIDKYQTNRLLEQAGIPVPKSIILHAKEFEPEHLATALQDVQFPLVIKPLDGALGCGVLCNIKTLDELTTHLRDAFAQYPQLIIEEFHGKLKSYRILVFKKKIIGIVLRHPAAVIGDGVHTIKELIKLTNIQRVEINPYLGHIVIDEEARIKLKELQLSEEYIPQTGERIVLNYTSNATRGGTFETVNVKVCRKNRQLMRRIAIRLNLNLVGIDVECANLKQPIAESNGVILEVNYKPSVRIHELPLIGRHQPVTKRILRGLIYRHPLAYLYSLYRNKSTALYVKCCAVGVICVLTYSWLMHY